jgi:hypothetical protein|tara:strand:- start:12 stop:578 length:567 start_codon:yes stop_codon:yes gene_type:complete
MSRPTFFQEVVVALALSALGSALFAVLGQVTSPDMALKGIVSLVAMGYSGYLLGRCRITSGRVTMTITWFTIAAACWFGNLPLGALVLVHVGMVWVIRSLFYHVSPMAAFVDLILSGLGLAASVWAMMQSESLFMTMWCYFLVQALFVAIPTRVRPLAANHQQHEQQFQSAYRNAEAALGKLSATTRR